MADQKILDANGAEQVSVPTVNASAIVGVVAPNQGGTGIDTSAATGDIVVDSGTFTANTRTGTGNSVRATSPTLTSPTINTGVSGSAIDNDVTLAANSATLLPTQHAAKGYTDNSFLNFPYKDQVRVTAVSNIPANTYNNGSSGAGATLTGNSTGTLTIDGVLVTIGMRVLLAAEGTNSHNGIYICTTEGAVGVNYVLTRTTDCDEPTDVMGAFAFSNGGTAVAKGCWVNTNTSLPTIGSTGLTFSFIAGSGSVLLGTGLQYSVSAITIDSTVVTLTGSQTLTNKVLTTPTIASMANANHNHTNSAGGGQLTDAALSAAVGAAKGGTGIDTSALTGFARIIAGVWSVISLLTTALGGTGQDFSASTGTIVVASGTMSANTETGTGNSVRASSPTIVTPTVASLTNMQHNHTNAAGGGQLTDAALSAPVTTTKGGLGLNAGSSTGLPDFTSGSVAFIALPKRASMMHDEATVTTGNALAYSISATSFFNGTVFQSASANGDTFTHSFWLLAGTYTFSALGSKAASAAKIDWSFDGSVLVSGQDWYNATTVIDTVLTASVTITGDGYHVLKGTINGRNASNVTAFNMFLIKYWLKPSSD